MIKTRVRRRLNFEIFEFHSPCFPAHVLNPFFLFFFNGRSGVTKRKRRKRGHRFILSLSLSLSLSAFSSSTFFAPFRRAKKKKRFLLLQLQRRSYTTVLLGSKEASACGGK